MIMLRQREASEVAWTSLKALQSLRVAPKPRDGGCRVRVRACPCVRVCVCVCVCVCARTWKLKVCGAPRACAACLQGLECEVLC